MTNNVTPLVDPKRGFRVHRHDDLWNKDNPKVSIFPNLDDLVVKYDPTVFYRVIAVNYTTLEYELEMVTSVALGGVSVADELLGVDALRQNEMYRVYLDKTRWPHVLEFNRRVKWNGSESRSIKLFRGRDITSTGTPVSLLVDNTGEAIGENIPLEQLVAGENSYVAVTGYTSADLSNGEVVTAVSYNDNGTPLEIKSFLVQVTSLARDLNAGVKYVSGIEIVSSFVDLVDSSVIRPPVNLPTESLVLSGRVHYTDGSTTDLPLTGGRFKVIGLEDYQPQYIGEKTPVTAVYILDESERSTMPTYTPNHSVTRGYSFITAEVDNTYAVKLFVVPVWVDSITGYRLDTYLYDLSRQAVYPVARGLVEINQGEGYDGIDFGRIQRLRLAVNLKQVSGQFKAYRHVQDIEVLFQSGPDELASTHFRVNYTPGNGYGYGYRVKAVSTMVNGGNWLLDLSNGLGSREVWLQTMYSQSKPLFDTRHETAPLVPTHFIVQTGRVNREFPVAAWDTALAIPDDIPEGSTLRIRWIRRLTEGQLELAMTSVLVTQ